MVEALEVCTVYFNLTTETHKPQTVALRIGRGGLLGAISDTVPQLAGNSVALHDSKSSSSFEISDDSSFYNITLIL